MDLGETEGDALRRQLGGISSSIAAAVLSTCTMALASSTSQRVPAGSSAAIVRSRARTMSVLKNSRSP